VGSGNDYGVKAMNALNGTLLAISRVLKLKGELFDLNRRLEQMPLWCKAALTANVKCP
jgi:hypothetical protein